MEYSVVAGGDEYDLRKGVERRLEEGWLLAGGIAVVNTTSHKGLWFYQAMYRPIEEPSR